MVTAEEAAAGTYCASRLVLPLPGAAVVLPEEDLGAFYRTALAHEGIEMDDGVWLEVSASRDAEDEDNWLAIQGDYRPLLLRPQRMRWSVEPADDAAAGASDVAPASTSLPAPTPRCACGRRSRRRRLRRAADTLGLRIRYDS